MVALAHPPTRTSPLPPPVHSIHDITGNEKLSTKPVAFNYLVELAIKIDNYITSLIIQYIWCD